MQPNGKQLLCSCPREMAWQNLRKCGPRSEALGSQPQREV